MNFKGLSSSEVKRLQEKYGKNEIDKKTKENFLIKILKIIIQPMFLLLLSASTIYFILGHVKDGMIMLISIVGIIAIEIIQEWKTDRTLNALKKMSDPKVLVLRDNKKIVISSVDLVPGDIIFINEGVKVPADGFVLKESGLKVDESILTGESVAVLKTSEKEENDDYWKKNYCYQGTLVVQGSGVVLIDKIGEETEYGKIGANLKNIKEEKTPLQRQINKLIKVCAIIAFCLFVLVVIITFINLNEVSFNKRIIDSVLSGITLAMSIIPEEFPVILTIFLSMGAWRLAKKTALVKKLQSVETLGAISVLCVDKTGTITQNKMVVKKCFTKDLQKLSNYMYFSCQEDSIDPMEKALKKYAKENTLTSEIFEKMKIIKEYPFTNEVNMMGNVVNISRKYILAVKGSHETVLEKCKLSKKDKEMYSEKIDNMQQMGLRVIVVAGKEIKNKKSIKNEIEDKLELIGIVGLVDPPRTNVDKYIKDCHDAGIKVVMITGDNGVTARAIANEIGLDQEGEVITGLELDKMSDKELLKVIKNVSIFSRVRPEHKMRIVKAFQRCGKVVAMTGDGVNDAPALKQANIGIAMGKRGAEVCKEAASIILLDDNFKTIVDTIKDGRRIYDNIQKAIGYIFVIHIPIILSALIAPILKIPPINLLLLPVHIVLMELIIDPTCSIVLERQPADENIMKRKPRKLGENIVNLDILVKSILQGLTIFVLSFTTYFIFVDTDPLKARTMGLIIIMLSNVFLVLENLSDTEYVYSVLKKVIKDFVFVLINIIIIIFVLLISFTNLGSYLDLTRISFAELMCALLLSLIAVFWYELVKLNKKFDK